MQANAFVCAVSLLELEPMAGEHLGVAYQAHQQRLKVWPASRARAQGPTAFSGPLLRLVEAGSTRPFKASCSACARVRRGSCPFPPFAQAFAACTLSTLSTAGCIVAVGLCLESLKLGLSLQFDALFSAKLGGSLACTDPSNSVHLWCGKCGRGVTLNGKLNVHMPSLDGHT